MAWELERSKRKCVLEEIDEVKKKKRIDAEIKSLKDTADEFCTKVEATAKLTFVTQANAICKGQTLWSGFLRCGFIFANLFNSLYL